MIFITNLIKLITQIRAKIMDNFIVLVQYKDILLHLRMFINGYKRDLTFVNVICELGLVLVGSDDGNVKEFGRDLVSLAGNALPAADYNADENLYKAIYNFPSDLKCSTDFQRIINDIHGKLHLH